MGRNFLLFCTSVFLLVLGTYIAGTVLTPYAESLGATPLWLAFITSGLYIVRLLIGAPIGRLADHKGTLNVLTYSLVLYPFIAIAYWLAFSSWTLLGARLLHGLASAMMLPMAMAYIGQHSPVNQEGYYMGIYNTVTLIASGLGPQIATVITTYYGLKDTFFALFILALIALLLIFLIKNRRTQSDRSTSTRKTSSVTAQRLWGNPALIALSSVNIAMAVILSLMGFFFIKFPLARGINMVSVGTLIALYNLVTGFIQIPLGRICDRRNKYRLIVFFGTFVSVMLVLFPLCSNILMMIISVVLLGLLSAMILAASSALSTILGRQMGMNETMGYLGTATSLGMVLGCILLSVVPGYWGGDCIFYVSGGLFAICIVTFALLWRGDSKVSFKEERASEPLSY